MKFLTFLTFFTKFCSFPLLVTCQYQVSRQDVFALLSSTLQTIQTAACDAQILSLECPTRTKISIQLVQYGRSASSSMICPPTIAYPKVYSESETMNCMFSKALKFVEEKCHNRKSCSMSTNPLAFSSNSSELLCPGYRKYVEVAYKCKPTNFHSRIICNGDSYKLLCSNPKERILIISAEFESSSNSIVYCPIQLLANSDCNNCEEKCKSNYATEALMQICHGLSECVIFANEESLGFSYCDEKWSKLHLKVIYTCAHENVLRDEYRDRTLKSSQNDEDEDEYDKKNDSLFPHLFIHPAFVESQTTTLSSRQLSESYSGNWSSSFMAFIISSIHQIRIHYHQLLLLCGLLALFAILILLILFLTSSFKAMKDVKSQKNVNRPHSNSSFLDVKVENETSSSSSSSSLFHLHQNHSSSFKSPLKGILRMNKESRTSLDRPIRSPFQNLESEFSDPRCLTLSRLSSNCDQYIYG